jgi:hypothetical protein
VQEEGFFVHEYSFLSRTFCFPVREQSFLARLSREQKCGSTHGKMASSKVQSKTIPHGLAFANVLTIVSHKMRWLILRELMKGKPLPVMELARRTGAPATNVSKHMKLMLAYRVVERGFGGLYELPAHFIVPGENAIDFGATVLRLYFVD